MTCRLSDISGGYCVLDSGDDTSTWILSPNSARCLHCTRHYKTLDCGHALDLQLYKKQEFKCYGCSKTVCPYCFNRNPEGCFNRNPEGCFVAIKHLRYFCIGHNQTHAFCSLKCHEKTMKAYCVPCKTECCLVSVKYPSDMSQCTQCKITGCTSCVLLQFGKYRCKDCVRCATCKERILKTYDVRACKGCSHIFCDRASCPSRVMPFHHCHRCDGDNSKDGYCHPCALQKRTFMKCEACESIPGTHSIYWCNRKHFWSIRAREWVCGLCGGDHHLVTMHSKHCDYLSPSGDLCQTFINVPYVYACIHHVNYVVRQPYCQLCQKLTCKDHRVYCISRDCIQWVCRACHSCNYGIHLKSFSLFNWRCDACRLPVIRQALRSYLPDELLSICVREYGASLCCLDSLACQLLVQVHLSDEVEVYAKDERKCSLRGRLSGRNGASSLPAWLYANLGKVDVCPVPFDVHQSSWIPAVPMAMTIKEEHSHIFTLIFDRDFFDQSFSIVVEIPDPNGSRQPEIIARSLPFMSSFSPSTTTS